MKKKLELSTIALILTLTLSAIFAVLPVYAPLDLPADIPTFLFVSVSPDPVGVNQIVWVQAIFTKPLPTSQGMNGDRHENVTIEVTAPDASKTVMGPFTGGMTGGVATSFTPTQVGEYTFKAFYPGQVSTLTNPYNPNPGGWMQELIGSTFLPSESPPVSLTVQSDPVEFQYQTPPLPTEYWTRPVYATNWGWGKEIASNWYGLGSTGFTTCGAYDAIGGFQLYGTAPNTAHIMWTKPTRFGGQPGGPIASDQSTQYSSTSVTVDYFDGPIIMNGILFYTKFAGWGSAQNVIYEWEAVDIRTGEVLWSKPAGLSGEEWLRYGQIFRVHNVQEYGSHAFLWSIDAEGGGIFGPGGAMVFRLYDAYTGEHVCNITTEEGEADTSAYARNLGMIVDNSGDNPGGLIGYYTVGDQLYMWNSTRLFERPPRGSSGRVSISFQNYTFSDGIQWNVTRELELNGKPVTLGLQRVTEEVLLLRQSEAFIFQGTNYGYQVTAGIDAKTGALLWGPINQTLPFLEDADIVAARDGYYFLYNSDAREANMYSLTNGQKVWGPIAVPSDTYGTLNVWAQMAYGKVIFNGGGGVVNCMDAETGNLDWTWTRGSSGYDTPFGVYPIFGYGTQVVADGKIFLTEGYLYTPPLHPSRLVAIDIDTGETEWSILAFNSRASCGVADGYLIDWNSFDNQLYSFGKGPSETNVLIKNNVLSQGSSVLIEGTVMDNSAGASQEGVKQRFPHGLPAVADEDMREWMEYVYMQQIKPADVTGVEVFVKILDPNGDWYGATVTTDETGMFSHSWAPAIVGDYYVTAIFEGSESYYTSYATTTFSVDQAPEAAAYLDVPTANEIAQATVNRLPAYPDVPSAGEVAQETINRLPAYPDVPTASEVAQETVNQMPEIPEIPAYLTIDLVIIAAVVIAIIIGLYGIVKKQK